MNNTNYSDPRNLFAAAVAVATPIIEATEQSDFAKPTPCGEFNVEQLLGHLVFVVKRVASAGRGENQFGPQVDTVSSDDYPADWRAATADRVAGRAATSGGPDQPPRTLVVRQIMPQTSG